MKRALLFTTVCLLYLMAALPMKSAAQSKNINTYVLFALEQLEVKGGNPANGTGNIYGNIGVNQPSSTISNNNSLIFASSGSVFMGDGYEAVADKVRGDAGGSFYDLYANTFAGNWGAVIRNLGPVPTSFPLTANGLVLPPLGFTPCRALTNTASDLTIAQNQTVTITTTPLRDLKIMDNSIVTFGPGTFDMRSFTAGKNVTIIVDPATVLQVDQTFRMNNDFKFGDFGTESAKIYVGSCGVSSTTKTTFFSRRAEVHANYYAPNGILDIGDNSNLYGRFWARRITEDGNNNVYIPDTPECIVTVNSPVICPGESAIISAFTAPPGVFTYTWTVPAGVPDPGNVASFTASVEGTYSVTVTDGISLTCSGSGTLTFDNCPQPCFLCAKAPLVKVDENVTVDFNTNPPTYTGDPDLLPYFTFNNSGATPDLWYASFNLLDQELLITNGAKITVTKVGIGNNQYAPGIKIFGTCKIKIDYPSAIVVESLNKQAGDISIVFEGDVVIDGEVRNEVKGTNGMPGAILIKSECAQIYIGPNGRVLDLGVDWGGNLISLLTCGDNPPGNIIVDKGLVKAFAHAHADNLDETRPRIKVVSSGGVTINASTLEPIHDEFAMGGGRWDIYPGLLSWVRDNAKPGMVWVQAEHDITVLGHGTDPTPPVRKSFGAIAAISARSDAPGGLVDVRSIGGNIFGFDRAFDVSGRNRLLLGNFANIKLFAFEDIELSNTGNPTGNPVVDASGAVAGDKGGIIEMVSHDGGITVGANALVTAAVPAGLGSVQGQNLVTVCDFLVNNGTIVPAPVLTTSCTPGPAPLFDCNGALKQSAALLPGTVKPAVTGEMILYPNPATESFILQISNEGEQNAVMILQDITGKVIERSGIQLREGVNMHTVNVAGLAEGLYIVKLQTGTQVRQLKLMVKH